MLFKLVRKTTAYAGLIFRGDSTRAVRKKDACCVGRGEGSVSTRKIYQMYNFSGVFLAWGIQQNIVWRLYLFPSSYCTVSNQPFNPAIPPLCLRVPQDTSGFLLGQCCPPLPISSSAAISSSGQPVLTTTCGGPANPWFRRWYILRRGKLSAFSGWGGGHSCVGRMVLEGCCVEDAPEEAPVGAPFAFRVRAARCVHKRCTVPFVFVLWLRGLLLVFGRLASFCLFFLLRRR